MDGEENTETQHAMSFKMDGRKSNQKRIQMDGWTPKARSKCWGIYEHAKGTIAALIADVEERFLDLGLTVLIMKLNENRVRPQTSPQQVLTRSNANLGGASHKHLAVVEVRFHLKHRLTLKLNFPATQIIYDRYTYVFLTNKPLCLT
jgi:hypothetical protein